MSTVSLPRPVGRIPMLVMATAHAGRTFLLATLLTVTKWIRSQTMPALYPPGHEEKMRQARFLFRCGYITAAGMIARVAVERHLIKTCSGSSTSSARATAWHTGSTSSQTRSQE